ncbi:MAG: hypothetical protein JW829_05850 [Pirellulales bacterium]|nr:hypothetical protein [Pirellulales bacterium]
MSIGSFGGVTGSAAGAPLSSTQGSETERLQKDAASQIRQIDHEKHADDTAGIGHTEEDQETSDRDADGRRLWERAQSTPGDSSSESKPRQSKDINGISGNALDLTG